VGRVLLIIGAVVGVLIFALGVLALIGTATTPNPDPAGYYGSFLFMGVGAAIAAPCIFFARRLGARSTPPSSQGGMSLAPTTGGDLTQSYLAWFAWCQQALGGDAVSLHATTMAALAGGAAGNPTAAASAEAGRQASRIAAMGVVPTAPNQAKVRSLSRIGASTVGLLEPSERVVVSFWGLSRTRQAQLWGLAFGAIGGIIAASQTGAAFVTLTDRRVIVLRGGQFGGLANQVALIEPRSTVSAKFQRPLLTLPRTFTLTGLDGRSVSISIPKSWRPEAEMALAQLAPSVGQIGSVGIIR
jgi:hypothetical protein